MQKHFTRAIAALGDIFEFIDGYGAANGIAPAPLYAVKFVVEELFTNMVKYSASDAGHDVLIGIEAGAGLLTVRLTDTGVDAFDVTAAGDADVSLGLEERKIGGLGLHLVKKMVDSLEYEYRDRQSIITFTKHLEHNHV
jgi:anti-sigma regulatory factor (Ser/Thr protein kinase)